MPVKIDQKNQIVAIISYPYAFSNANLVARNVPPEEDAENILVDIFLAALAQDT